MTRCARVVLALALPAAAGEKEWKEFVEEGERLLEEKKYPEAEAKLRAALKEIERVQTDERLSTTLTDLADALRGRGRLADAEPYYRRALEVLEKVFGVDDPMLAGAVQDLGDLWRDLEKDVKAEAYYRRALKLVEGEKGADDAETAWACLDLGSCLRRLRKLPEAEPLLKRALGILEKAGSAVAADLAEAEGELAALRMTQGKAAEAEPLLASAVKRLEGSQDLPDALEDWAMALRALKKEAEAAEAEKRAAELRSK